MSSRGPRYFTVEEANRMLPLVRRIVQDIVELYPDLKARHDHLAAMRRDRSPERSTDGGHRDREDMEARVESDLERLREYVAELEQLGVELKDPRTGLIDFRTRIDDREAYLCWRLGEDEIAYWHDLEAGFAGRQSLYEEAAPDGSATGSGRLED